MYSQAKWDYAAHDELKAILAKLKTRFATRLNVLPSEPYWLTFQVHGCTDIDIMRTLEREQFHFFGLNINRFQILSEQTGKERGVSICYLDSPTELNTAGPYTGFWHY
jgi:hypothetical protein